MDVLSPLGAAPIALAPLAPRRSSLRGCRVGILDNSKPNADVLLDRVAGLLAERAGAGPIRRWRKPGAARPADVVADVVAGADVVLTGSAD